MSLRANDGIEHDPHAEQCRLAADDDSAGVIDPMPFVWSAIGLVLGLLIGAVRRWGWA